MEGNRLPFLIELEGKTNFTEPLCLPFSLWSFILSPPLYGKRQPATMRGWYNHDNDQANQNYQHVNIQQSTRGSSHNKHVVPNTWLDVLEHLLHTGGVHLHVAHHAHHASTSKPDPPCGSLQMFILRGVYFWVRKCVRCAGGRGETRPAA